MQNKSNISASRKLTLNERLYRINEEVSTPFAIQYIIEGEGLLDPSEVELKLGELSTYIPALKLIQNGNRWSFNGAMPTLNVHQNAIPVNWNSHLYKGAISEGHCCEFHLFQTDNSTLVFRVLHSAMDGIGGLKVLEQLFALLNHQKIQEIPHYLSDVETRNSLSVRAKKKRPAYRFKWKSLEPVRRLDEPVQYKTAVIQTPKRVDQTIGKVAKWFMNQTDDSAQFLIPVNIRRHAIPKESVSNLSFPIYLKTKPEDDASTIQSNLLTELANNSELAKDPMEWIGKRAPNWALKMATSKIGRKAVRKNLFPMSGFISDFGMIDLSTYSTPSFKANDLYSLPVFTIAAPFCVTICHHKNGSRIAFSVPIDFNIQELKESLSAELLAVPDLVEVSADNVSFGDKKEVLQHWSECLNCEVTNIDVNTSFSSLGGESVNLLMLITTVGEQYASADQSDFMMNVLKHGVEITPNSMMEILSKYA